VYYWRALIKKEFKMLSSILNIFKRDYELYDGVRKINIYLLRVLYTLIFVFVGKSSWTYIGANYGVLDPMEGVVWSVWASFSVLSFIGIIYPLKMLPIILLEILYKVIWLLVVAYPLWSVGQLEGSDAEGLFLPFVWVIFPIVAVPWKYVFKKYVYTSKNIGTVQASST
jgi:hypothetical protein